MTTLQDGYIEYSCYPHFMALEHCNILTISLVYILSSHYLV